MCLKGKSVAVLNCLGERGQRLSPKFIRKYALKLPLGFCMTSEIFFWFHLNRK